MDDSPSPKQKWGLTPEAFDMLLTWLDPDRQRAGEMYEEIYTTLIKRFRQLGCSEPEELADRTLDRVAKKLPEVIATYRGEQVPYVYSVAHYIHLEYLREPSAIQLPPNDLPPLIAPSSPIFFEEDELMDDCLEQCLARLPSRDRELILQYYTGELQEKIRRRKELAERLGIKLPNLRLRAQRIRVELKRCVLDCLEGKGKA